MRASQIIVFTAVLIALLQPVRAESAKPTQASAADTAALLAAAATQESARLTVSNQASDRQLAEAQTKATSSDKRAARSQLAKARREALRLRLANAEKERVRDKYRELQLQRIAANSPVPSEMSSD